MNAFRGLIFNICYTLSILIFSIPAVLIGPFIGFRGRTQIFLWWPKILLLMLRLICGIRYRIVGLENIPNNQPVVLVSNHQSTWETLAFYVLFSPVSAVLKKELTYIPIFGWLLHWTQPIIIDRSKRTQALKDILNQGKTRLAQGSSVLIFPEGTRVPANQSATHFPGGAMLAVKSGFPILPIVHNSGDHWPAHSIKKYPGVITVKIGKAILPDDISAKALNAQLESWMNHEKETLSNL